MPLVLSLRIMTKVGTKITFRASQKDKCCRLSELWIIKDPDAIIYHNDMSLIRLFSATKGSLKTESQLAHLNLNAALLSKSLWSEHSADSRNYVRV